MNELLYLVLILFVFVIFFGLSVSCVVIWFKSFKKTQEILRNVNEHWSVKLAIYYGIFFSIFLVVSIFISLVVAVAFALWSGVAHV